MICRAGWVARRRRGREMKVLRVCFRPLSVSSCFVRKDELPVDLRSAEALRWRIVG